MAQASIARRTREVAVRWRIIAGQQGDARIHAPRAEATAVLVRLAWVGQADVTQSGRRRRR